MLGLADDAPLAAPAFPGTVSELLERAGRLAGCLESLLHVVEVPSQNLGGPLVLRQPEHIIHAVFLTPGHQGLAAEAAVAAQNDPHARPRRTKTLADPGDLLDASRCSVGVFR